MVAEYTVPISSLETYAENCTVNPRCGECCDIHQGEAIFISLTSNAGSPVFNITMRTDFINYTPVTKPDDEGDLLEISANNKLTGRWRFPDPIMEPAVTVGGQTFTDVLVLEDNTITDPNEIAALYFTRKEGVVGFKYGDGEAWALVP
jgi:hypothetical protein